MRLRSAARVHFFERQFVRRRFLRRRPRHIGASRGRLRPAASCARVLSTASRHGRRFWQTRRSLQWLSGGPRCNGPYRTEPRCCPVAGIRPCQRLHVRRAKTSAAKRRASTAGSGVTVSSWWRKSSARVPSLRHRRTAATPREWKTH